MGENLPQGRDSCRCLFIRGCGQLASYAGQLVVTVVRALEADRLQCETLLPKSSCPWICSSSASFWCCSPCTFLPGLPVKRGHSINVADVMVQILKKLQTRYKQEHKLWAVWDTAQAIAAAVFQGASHPSLGFFFSFNSCISRLGVWGFILSVWKAHCMWMCTWLCMYLIESHKMT